MYLDLDVGLSTKIEKKVQECNEIAQKYNEYMQRKIDNTFSPIIISPLGLNDLICELNGLLRQLEKKRVEFNNLSQQTKQLKEKLININKQAAHNDIASDYGTYKQQLKEKRDIETKLQNSARQLNDDRRQLEFLRNKQKNTEIAIEQINKSLEYIFFLKDRLSIELKNDLYCLKSNGNDVRLNDVLCGERNIIALCYFFTQIMSNLEISQLYSTKKFIVIDDPVSSFDFENKIGIISFLKKQLSDIITGNSASKILILSHDLATIFDIQKAANEIGSLSKRLGNVKKTTFAQLEIKDQTLVRFTNNRSEYTEW